MDLVRLALPLSVFGLAAIPIVPAQGEDPSLAIGRAIEATLRRTGGNIKESAAQLGIDRSTLYDKIKRYGIERP